MKLEKVRKLATQGKIHANLCDIGLVKISKYISPGVVLDVADAQYNPNIAKDGDSVHNAALLAHCWNNFDDVVKTLECCAQSLENDHHYFLVLGKIKRILRKAKSVKVPKH